MKIPDGPRGFPTVSVSMLRSYGFAGFDLGVHEASKGCPRQFKARYVDRDVPKTRSVILEYGTWIHAAFEYMEEHSCSPEDALAARWDPMLGPDRYAEALVDLREYLERPAESASGAVIGSEVQLDAVLFETPDGPVYLRGTIDRVEVDFDDEFLIRVRDFKTNRTPPSLLDIQGDAQGKAYTWLVLQNLEKFGFAAHDSRVKVIFHLDAIKWHEMPPVYFDAADLEAWHAWMVAIVKHIQADDQALPVLNVGCAYCPVRDSCPSFAALPDVGSAELDELMGLLGTESVDKAVLLAALAEVDPRDRVDLVEWRDHANDVRLLLEKVVKEIDGRFLADARRQGGMAVGRVKWEEEDAYANTTDSRRLQTELGDSRFYRLVDTQITAAALEREVKGDEPGLRARAFDTMRRTLIGSTYKRKKGR